MHAGDGNGMRTQHTRGSSSRWRNREVGILSGASSVVGGLFLGLGLRAAMLLGGFLRAACTTYTSRPCDTVRWLYSSVNLPRLVGESLVALGAKDAEVCHVPRRNIRGAVGMAVQPALLSTC